MKKDLTKIPTETLLLFLDEIKKELRSRKKIQLAEKRKSAIEHLRPINYKHEHIFESAVLKKNSENLLSLPNMNQPVKDRKKYLPCLIAQDWSFLFENYSDESGEFYVYCHVDPRQKAFITSAEYGGNYGGMPFYIGKGVGNRAFDLKRNQGHGKTIRSIISDGFAEDDIVKILSSELSERAAMELESKLIYFFGTIYERDKGSYLVNLDLSKRPEFLGEMQKLSKRESCKSEYKKAMEKERGQ